MPLLLSVHKVQSLPLVRALPADPGHRKTEPACQQHVAAHGHGNNSEPTGHVDVRVSAVRLRGCTLNSLTAENVNGLVFDSLPSLQGSICAA